MTIVINWNGTGATDECESVEAAQQSIERKYPDAVYADQWDADGRNDDGQRMERLLVWASEEDAGPVGSGDDGAHAICEITRVA